MAAAPRNPTARRCRPRSRRRRSRRRRLPRHPPRPDKGRIRPEHAMNPNQIADEAARLADHARELALQAPVGVAPMEHMGGEAMAVAPIVFLFAVFLMACFVGYYVVWNVTPALHSPLMAVT